MSLLTSSMRLLAKYGKAAKVVVSGVLNVVAPGSGAILELAGEALEAAQSISEASQRDRWEEELRVRLGTSAAELARLGQLLDCLVGPLAVLCDKAAVFADQAEDLPDIIARALAANPSLSQALRAGVVMARHHVNMGTAVGIDENRNFRRSNPFAEKQLVGERRMQPVDGVLQRVEDQPVRLGGTERPAMLSDRDRPRFTGIVRTIPIESM